MWKTLQYLGCIDNFLKARFEAQKVARETGLTVVLEKAKRKDGPHRYTTYRAWLDRELHVNQVIDIKDWQKLHPEIYAKL